MDRCLGSHGASLPPGSLRNVVPLAWLDRLRWTRVQQAARPLGPPGDHGRADQAGKAHGSPRRPAAATRHGNLPVPVMRRRHANGCWGANGCCGTSGPQDRRIPGTAGVWSSTTTTSLTDATHCGLIHYRSCGTNQLSASASAVTQGGYLARWLDARVRQIAYYTGDLWLPRSCGPDWAHAEMVAARATDDPRDRLAVELLARTSMHRSWARLRGQRRGRSGKGADRDHGQR